MTLYQAKIKLAHLILKVAQFHKKNASDNPSPEIKQKIFDLNNSLDDLGSELASYPSVRPHMECWLVEVEGIGSFSREDISSLLDGNDVSIVVNSVGMLFSKLLDELISLGWEIAHKSFNTDGWIIELSCTDEQANKLCNYIHENYSTEIAANAIKVKKKFHCYKFKDIKTWEDAEIFIKNSVN